MASIGATTGAVFRVGAAASAQSRTFERLSTGLRINRGADDPAGLIASERLGARAEELRTQVDVYEREIASLNIEEAELASESPGEASAEARGEIGMRQRELESQRRAAQTEYINTVDARSRIRDTDYAEAVSTRERQGVQFEAAMMALRIANTQAGSVVSELIGSVIDTRG